MTFRSAVMSLRVEDGRVLFVVCHVNMIPISYSNLFELLAVQRVIEAAGFNRRADAHLHSYSAGSLNRGFKSFKSATYLHASLHERWR